MEVEIEGSDKVLITELPYGEQLDSHLAEMFEGSEWVGLFKNELKARGFEMVSSLWLADLSDA